MPHDRHGMLDLTAFERKLGIGRLEDAAASSDGFAQASQMNGGSQVTTIPSTTLPATTVSEAAPAAPPATDVQAPPPQNNETGGWDWSLVQGKIGGTILRFDPGNESSTVLVF